MSQTIKGLHWDKVSGDNDDEVAARGILYLLIFQQLGQLVRWSWGYNVLLAPPDEFDGTDENRNSRLENGGIDEERRRLMEDSDDIDDGSDESGSEETRVEGRTGMRSGANGSQMDNGFRSGEQTPVIHRQNASSASSRRSLDLGTRKPGPAPKLLPTPTNGNVKPTNHITSFPSIRSAAETADESVPKGIMHHPIRCKIAVKKRARAVSDWISEASTAAFRALPSMVQTGLAKAYGGLRKFLLGLWSFMNPPLWAMLAAIVVASIPKLQRFFFADGTFFKNSVTSAIRQSGGVAVPLILVVLGGNLARNTLPNENHTKEDEKEDTKLLIAALISRMLLPTIIMAPLLALTAKFVPVSILDDPIFVIVCFLITGAPSALQLAQICQINNVYMGAMSRLLFQSYVVWILPSTLVLVMCALEVVEWAQR